MQVYYRLLVNLVFKTKYRVFYMGWLGSANYSWRKMTRDLLYIIFTDFELNSLVNQKSEILD